MGRIDLWFTDLNVLSQDQMFLQNVLFLVHYLVRNTWHEYKPLRSKIGRVGFSIHMRGRVFQGEGEILFSKFSHCHFNVNLGIE